MENRLKQWWESNRASLCFCIIAVFVFGLFAHAFQFFNFQYAHDSLDGLYVIGRENAHKIELGRMFSPVYRYVFGGNFSAPWLIGFLSLLWVAVAAFCVVKCLDIKNKAATALVCGVMAVNITYIGLAATFIHDLDADMFALMMACVAVYLWKERFAKWLWLPLGAVAICISLGIYQSYISVSVVMVALILLNDVIDGAELKGIIGKAAGAVVMSGIGGVMYYIAVKITPRITGVPMAQRWNSVTEIGNLEIADIPQLVIEAYQGWFEYFISYKSNWTDQRIIAVFNLLVMVSLIVMAAVILVRKKLPVLCRIAVVAIIALLPLCMNIIRVLSPGGHHDLMTYSFVFLYIAAFAMAEKLEVKPVRIICCLCTAAVLFASVQAANELYLKRNLAYQATFSRMNNVVHDMLQAGYAEYDDDGREYDRVYIDGNTKLHYYREFGYLDDIKEGNIDNAVTSDMKSIEHYFKYVLGLYVEFCSEEEIAAIEKTEEYQNMPKYPHDGYIQYINDVMVVKLN